MEIEEFLAHHGVKGMKWGQHRFGRVQKDAGYATGKSHPAGSGKPPWQSPPAPRSKTVAHPAAPKKATKGKQPSEDALEIQALRQKVKKHGAASLTNDDLAKIAKRAELQSKYNKAYPKKPGMKAIAAEAAITFALSEFGAKKLSSQAIKRISDPYAANAAYDFFKPKGQAQQLKKLVDDMRK